MTTEGISTEFETDEGVQVYLRYGSLNCVYRDEDLHVRASATASIMIFARSTFWYFNRLIVDPPEARGQGIGSRLVRALQQALRLDPRGLPLVCEANPYDGRRKLPDLIRFYERHGFVREKGYATLLIWSPTGSTI